MLIHIVSNLYFKMYVALVRGVAEVCDGFLTVA